jgi:hypothetical protein
MKNPLTNAHIIGIGYDSTQYTMKPYSRGEKGYIMSRSSLKDFAPCPSKWRKYGDGEDDGTTSTEWGSLVDCLLLERDKFEKRYAIKPEQYPVEDKKTGAIVEWKDWNANSTWCKNWMAEQDGLTCISSGALKEAKKAVEIAEKEFAQYLDGSKYQVCIHAEYKDRDTGLVVPICGLIDIVTDKELVDFKTARSADLTKWPREVYSRGYDMQAALYLDLYEATGTKFELFRHIIQENSHPYECATVPLSVEFINLGRQRYTAALKRYCHCLATDHWDSYTDLHTEHKRGLNICEPESWMQVEQPRLEDPDFMTEAA